MTVIFLINRYLAVAYSISMILSLCVVTEAVSTACLISHFVTSLLTSSAVVEVCLLVDADVRS